MIENNVQSTWLERIYVEHLFSRIDNLKLVPKIPIIF